MDKIGRLNGAIRLSFSEENTMLFVYSANDCRDKSAIRTKNNPAHLKCV